MPKKNFLGVVGHTNLDYVFDIPKFPDPKAHASVEVTGENLFFGGTAGNVARVGSQLGLKVGICSMVGDDFPQAYLEYLKMHGVDLTDFKIMKDRRTPCCWILTDLNGDQVSIINQGAMNHMHKQPLPSHTLQNSEIIHLMTGPIPIMMKIAEAAHSEGLPVGFDPCQTTYWYSKEELEKILTVSHHAFFNEIEAAAVLKKIGKNNEKDFLDFLEWIIITRHAKGSTIHQRGKEPIQVGIAKPAKLVDPTGAGDAYRAGFYLGMSKKFDFQTCGQLAATVASFIVETVGSQTNIPTKQQVEERFRENFGKSIKL